jgi:methanethiol oxidase
MNRREFLTATSATALTVLGGRHSVAADKPRPGFSSPAEAQKAPREKLLYVTCLYGNTGVRKPDYLATLDVDPASPSYGKVLHRLSMPRLDDELHHFGWNICSSCHGQAKDRRYLIVPGLKSSRIHVLDALDPKAPRLHKVIEPETVRAKANLSAPHTVHCLPDGTVMVSMLGDASGNGPGGFLLLDPSFDVLGRWEKNADGMKYNYDFWYQPRHNVMVSSEWAAPKTYGGGFDPKDVEAGKYGTRLHFWDWKAKRVTQSIDLGADGYLPLEVRFLHDPVSTHGFIGAALSGTIWHWHKAKDGRWQADKVVTVPAVEVKGSSPLPAAITDSIISMDDR